MTQYYLEHHYGRAGAAHRRAFEELLGLPDPQLHDILTGKLDGGSSTVNDIARLVRERCGS